MSDPTFTRKNRSLIHETDGIPERIDSVEAPLAPGLNLNLGVDALAAQLTGAIEDRVHIFHGKINVLWIGPGIAIVAVGRGSKHTRIVPPHSK